jgi:hypothetical protein
MKTYLELPPDLDPSRPGFIQRLNESFRRIQELLERSFGAKGEGDLDMAGHRVINLGNPRQSGDAVSVAYLECWGRGVKAAAAPPAAAIAATVTQTLLLAVPGVLAIQADAAPLVTLAAETGARSVEALVKRAPVGADLKCKVLVDGTEWAMVTIENGETGGAVADPTTLPPIGAGKPIRADLTEVGTTFPGADLSLLIRFSG